MGVLNITPDSFSDGGRWFTDGRSNLDAIRRAADRMVSDGAAVLDIGGESTRPGAVPVSTQEEMDRVLPVVEALAGSCEAILSLDSSNPAVMRAAAERGVGLLNDVRAFQRTDALATAAALGLPVCIMHMQGAPDTMQRAPRYDNALSEVADFLRMRAQACLSAGIDAQHIIVDPGFGFGKSLEHNLQLLQGLGQLRDLGYPILVGLSRKSMIAKLTGRAVEQRLAGSLALALLAAERGASVLRVHDVAETADVLRVLAAVIETGK